MTVICVRIVSAVLIIGWQVSALSSGATTGDGVGDKMRSDFPASLAGCTTGNFAAEGPNGCKGVQRLQCDKSGECTGTLQGKPYQINCNQKHECISHKWGDAFVRKFLSSTKHGGSVQWNNGCTWTCEDVPSAFVRKHTTGWWWQSVSGLPTERMEQILSYVARTDCDRLITVKRELSEEVVGMNTNKKTLLLGMGIIGNSMGLVDAYGADVAGAVSGEAAKTSFEHGVKIPALVVDGFDNAADFVEAADSVIEADLGTTGDKRVQLKTQVAAGRKVALGFANFVIFGIALGAEVLCHGACMGSFVTTAHHIMAPINVAALTVDIRDAIDQNAEIAFFTSKINEVCKAQIDAIVGEGVMNEMHLGPNSKHKKGGSMEDAFTRDPGDMLDCTYINPKTAEYDTQCHALGGIKTNDYVPRE